jgi:hypothetical protein
VSVVVVLIRLPLLRWLPVDCLVNSSRHPTVRKLKATKQESRYPHVTYKTYTRTPMRESKTIPLILIPTLIVDNFIQARVRSSTLRPQASSRFLADSVLFSPCSSFLVCLYPSSSLCRSQIPSRSMIIWRMSSILPSCNRLPVVAAEVADDKLCDQYYWPLGRQALS